MKGLGASLFGLIVLLALLLTGAGASAGESRIALVIGNSGYLQVPRLTNPQKDAEAVAATFRNIGFKTVTLRHDLGRDAMNTALHVFAREAEKADWAVVYYAGHGIEYAGVNYVIPTDATLASDRDVQFEALPLSQILGAVEGARKLRLVILDACRDNPFLGRMKRSVASRSIGRGLARVEPGGGVLVAFAAKEGEVALDGDEGNSPFTTALVKHVQTPGLEINRLFRRVRSEVLLATNLRQEPYVYGSLPDEDFFFTPATTEKPSRVVAVPEPADRLNGAEPLQRAGEEAAAPLADRTQPKPADPPPAVTLPPAQPPDVGSLVIQSQDAKASEAKPSPPATDTTAPPLARTDRMANLSQPTKQDESSKAQAAVSPSPGLASAIQSELHRLGCETGSTDGSWGRKNRAALTSFGRHAGRTLDPEHLDDAVLDDMKQRRGRVCPLVCPRGYVARNDACVLQGCPANQVRNASGICIALPRPAPPARTIVHARTPPEPILRRRPIEAPSPRIAAPPPRIVVPPPRVAPPPPPKRVARVAPRPPAAPAPSRRHCQVFNGQSVCD